MEPVSRSTMFSSTRLTIVHGSRRTAKRRLRKMSDRNTSARKSLQIVSNEIQLLPCRKPERPTWSRAASLLNASFACGSSCSRFPRLLCLLLALPRRPIRRAKKFASSYLPVVFSSTAAGDKDCSLHPSTIGFCSRWKQQSAQTALHVLGATGQIEQQLPRRERSGHELLTAAKWHRSRASHKCNEGALRSRRVAPATE